MKPQAAFQSLLIILVIVSLACSQDVPGFVKLETGPTETMTLNEQRPGTDAAVDVNLSMAVGVLNLSGGAEGLLEGEVRYNVAAWKPTVTSTESSLSVVQGDGEDTSQGIPGDDLVNTWDLRLGDVPMNLTLVAGAYDATIDLSGLPLRRLAVQDGASQSEVRFDALNPEEMQDFAYQTGASEIRFSGLANANFGEMAFEGGAGEYTFDFSGELQRDATVNIQVGFSTVRIIVPAGVPAQVVMKKAVGDIRAAGTWQNEAGTYVNPGSGPRIDIVVEMGAGELHLGNE